MTKVTEPIELERRSYRSILDSTFDDMLNLAIELSEYNVDYFIENTKHDITSYESCNYQREILSDANFLFEGFQKASSGSNWKATVQKYEINYLYETYKLQEDLKTLKYKPSPTNDFILQERGKTRYVSGEDIRDRVAKHVLCDEILSPELRRFLIYDNGASLKGRGIDFTRKRLIVHLNKYYREHGTNKGYILLIDFSKYYDNIRHAVLKKIFNEKLVLGPISKHVLEKIIESARVDVSYLSEEDYKRCLDLIFNSLDYQRIPKNMKTGNKFMDKHLNIGDQLAQIAGILYPTQIDNFIKIRCGMKYYGRYMDDSYIISDSKETLKELLKKIKIIANELGIFINEKKTIIVPLDSNWKFLQSTYNLGSTGRIMIKINKKRLTSMRRKMKKLSGILTSKEFDQFYHSWFNAHYKRMSKLQRENFDQLYTYLKGEIESRCTK